MRNQLKMYEDNITATYVTNLLKKYRIRSANDGVVVDQLVDIFRKAGLDKATTRNLIKQAKNAAIILSSKGEYVSSSHLKEIFDKINFGMIEAVSDVYTRFFESLDADKKLGIDINGEAVTESKGFADSLREIVSNAVHKNDQELLTINQDTIDNMNTLAYIYSELKKYLPQSVYSAKTDSVFRYADAMLNRLVSTQFLSHMNNHGKKAVHEVLETLTSDAVLGNDRFDSEELYRLLNKTSSILYTSGKDKIEGLKENIEKYKDYLLGFVGSDKKFEDLINENISFKKIINKSGVVLSLARETQVANMLLYTGDSLKDAVKKAVKNTGKDWHSIISDMSDSDLEKFGGMRVSILPDDLYNILVSSPSLALSAFTPSKLYDIGNEFDQILTQLFDDGLDSNPRLNKDQFSIDNLVTGKNLVDLLRLVPDRHKFDPNQDIRRQVIVDNIKILNTIMDGSQIFKIMQNNINVLVKDPSILQNDIDNLISQNMEDPANFDKQVNEYVNQLINNSGSRGSRLGYESLGTSRSSTSRMESLDIDDTFEIKTDYFKIQEEQKEDVESQEEKSIENNGIVDEINACFQKIYESFGLITNRFSYMEDCLSNGEIPNMDFSMSVHRACIVSNIKKIVGLIEKLEVVDARLARGYMQQLNLCKNNCYDIIEQCADKMYDISKESPKLENGREYHTTLGEGSLYDYIKNSKKYISNIVDESARSSALENMIRYEQESKGKIAQEFIDANADRVLANKLFMDTLPTYSFYANAIFEINKVENLLNEHKFYNGDREMNE